MRLIKFKKTYIYFSILLALTSILLFSQIFLNKAKADPVTIDLSGTAYTLLDPAFNYQEPVNISLGVNGVFNSTIQSDSNGEYLFEDLAINTGDVLTIYIDDFSIEGTSQHAVNITQISNTATDGTVVSNLYSEYLVLQSTGSDVLSNVTFNIADDVTDADVAYFYSADSHVTFNNNTSLYVAADTNFTIGGVLSTNELIMNDGSSVEVGAMSLAGSLFINSGASLIVSSDSTLNLYGDADQYFTQEGDISANISVLKTDGAVYLASNFNLSGNLTLTSNTQFFTNGYNFASTDLFVSSGNFNGSNGIITIADDIEVNGGTFGGGTASNVLYDIHLLSGNFTATSDTTTVLSAIYYEDGFNFQPNGGNFLITNNGTVYIVAPDVASPLIFWDLTIVNDSDDDANTTVIFESASLINVQGDLYMNGLDDSDRVNIFSNGDPFTLRLEGASVTINASWLWVRDSVLETFNTTGIDLPLNPAESIDAGNNTGWFTPPPISGVIYQEDRTTPIGAGREVVVNVNGAEIETVTTDVDGEFTTSAAISSGDEVLLYLNSNMDEFGTSLYEVDTDNVGFTGSLDLYQNFLRLDALGSEVLTEADLIGANTGIGFIGYDNGALIGGSFNSPNHLYIPSGSEVNIAASANILGDVLIDGDLAFNSSVEFKQSLIITGTLDIPDSETAIILNGGGTHNLSSTTPLPTQLVVTGGSEIITQSDIDIASNMSIEYGTLALGSYDFAVTGSLYMDHGNLDATTEGDFTVGGTFNITQESSALFASGNLSATNFHVSASDFIAPSGTTTVSEIFSVDDNSTFDANEGTVEFIGNENLILGIATFYNLTKVIPDATSSQILEIESGRTFTVENVLTLQGFDADHLLQLNATAEGQFFIHLLANATVTANYLDVANGMLSAEPEAVTVLPLNPTNSVDSGNNVGWFGEIPSFTIAGTAYYNPGNSNMEFGPDISLSINGVLYDTVTSNELGEYIFEDTTAGPGDVLGLWIEDANIEGTPIRAVNITLISSETSDEAPIVSDLYWEYLLLQDTGNESLTMNNLNTAHNVNDDDVSEVYSGGLDLTLHNDSSLYIANGSYFSTPPLRTIWTRNAIIGAGSTLQAYTLSLTGNIIIDFDGTLTTDYITMTGANNQYILQLGAMEGSIGINKTGGNVILESALDLNGNFTISSNTEVYTDDYNFAITGALTLYNGTFYGEESGYLAANHLQLSNVNATFFSPSGDVELTDLVIANGHFIASPTFTTVRTNFMLNDAATFDANEGTFQFSGNTWFYTDDDPADIEVVFYNLRINDFEDNTDSVVNVAAGMTLTVEGSLQIEGEDSNDRIILESNSDGERFFLKLQGENASIAGLNYLRVVDSQVVVEDSAIILPLNPANSINLGNTIGWFAPDNFTELLILNSPNSSTTHNSSVPFNITIPEAMLSGSLIITFTNADRTLEMDLFDIAANTPKIFNLNIDDLFAGGHIITLAGGGSDIILPDGTYTLIVSYQDAQANPAATVTRTNIIIDRSYVEPEEEEENQTTSSSSANIGNAAPVVLAQQATSSSTSSQAPVSFPTSKSSRSSSTSKGEELLTTQDEDDGDTEDNSSFPWWIILIPLPIIIAGYGYSKYRKT